MHSSDELNGRGIAWAGIAVAITLISATAGAYWAWKTWMPLQTTAASQSEVESPLPSPPLERAPQPALRAYLRDKDQQLHTWGWIDRSSGIARVPIDVAMQMLASGTTQASAGNVDATPKEKQ